jgi:hypothetical protein
VRDVPLLPAPTAFSSVDTSLYLAIESDEFLITEVGDPILY